MAPVQVKTKFSFVLSIIGKNFIGIVPVSCDELFKRIEAARAKAEKGEEYQVNIFPCAEINIFELFSKDTR